jgi:pSer/pThr/pTyr-binding forkhead associated (FHA) protein
MTSIPRMTVQLIHIQGPLKGQIHELNDPEIHIGRHPECQIQFPKDLTAVSRHHARIVREGNRFKLVDQSTNGSYVNGQRVAEAFLKDGDVITLSESGPKLSFLATPESAAAQPAAPREPDDEPVPEPRQPPAPPLSPPKAAARPLPPAAPPEGTVKSVKIPLAIQYGAALKSFQTLPVILGSGPGADFSINHPGVMQRHVQIYFDEGRYWIKDLTGSGMVMIDGLPISGQAPLDPECQIALTPQGPRFRFMGGGRLAEIEAPQPVTSTATTPPQPAEAAPSKPKKPGVFKKFFS